MSGAILKGRIARREEDEQDIRTPEEHIVDGDFKDASGIPFAYRMNKLSVDLLDELGENHGDDQSNPSRI